MKRRWNWLLTAVLAVSLLAGDNVKLVTPEELASLYTEEKKVR